MQVREIMTREPACCTPETKLQDVARLMMDQDCGQIPVVDSKKSRKPVGVVTDRDITTRAVAAGKNPGDLAARDCMTTPVVTVTPETEVERCCQVLEQHQVRRVPVINDQGQLCGMVSQADIAKHASGRETAEVVRSISQPAASIRKL